MTTFLDDFDATGDIFAALGDRWSQALEDAADPKWWVESKGEEVWSQQAAILDSVRHNRYTAVHSAHDLGKSFIASRTIAWWISSHPVGSAFVVSTAPSAAQVSAIMWREVGKIHRAAKLEGRITMAGYPQWKIDTELIGYGRKPADHEESAFQGIHAKYVLIVIDEACGVARHLYDAVDALATNEHARVLAIGNPDDPASHFAAICKPDSGWNVIHLDGLRSPNITKARVIGHKSAGYGYDNPKHPLLAALMEAEGIPYSRERVTDNLRDMLINEQWIEERMERWCGLSKEMTASMPREQLLETVRSRTEASPLFTSKVRGNFPTSASEGIIPLGWVQRAVERWHDLHDSNPQMHPSEKAHVAGNFILGVDVARTGNDETCFAERYGSYIPALHKARITDTMEVADKAAAFLHEPGSMAVIDVIGIGSGVYDRLRQMKNEGLIVGEPIPFNAAGQSHRRDKLGQFRFRNDRAAAWWNFRELLDPTFGSKIAIPDDEELIEELVAVRYDHFVGGIMTVEAKDDIKRRIGRSTDSADSVIQAFWIGNGGGKTEYIPYDESIQRPGARSRGAVLNYEGYDPFTDLDMAASLGSGMGLTMGGSPLSRFGGTDDGWSV